MARAADALALQDFLDGPARLLRRVGLLLAGSWAAADEAIGAAVADALRHGADVDDHAALERHLWPAMLQRLRGDDEAELVDEHHDATEPAGRLVEALATLPFDQRAAVVLTHLAHLGEPGIAHALGVTTEAAKSLYGKGIAALEADLARTGDRLESPSRTLADTRWRRPASTTTDRLDA